MTNPNKMTKTDKAENKAPAKSVDCAVVQDLMPLVIDDVASPASKDLVESHVKTCKKCAEIYGAMKAPEPKSDQNDAPMHEALKKTHKTLRKNHWMLITAVAGVLVLALVSVTLFLQAGKMDASQLNIDVARAAGDANELTVSIEPRNSQEGLLMGSLKEGKDGIINIDVTGGSGLYDQHSDLTYTLSNASDIQEIYCNGTLVWQNGTTIEPVTRDLFALHDGYAGDVPRIGKLIDLLNLKVTGAGYQMQLDTDNPDSCGWKFVIPDGSEQDEKILEGSKALLEKKCFLLFALTPNLDWVEFAADADHPVVRIDRQEYQKWIASQDGYLQENPQTAKQLQQIRNQLLI